jgi:hypothetical protein
MDVDYEFQPAFTLMTANLGSGESIKVEPGAMVAQSSGLSISTGRASKGGLILKPEDWATMAPGSTLIDSPDPRFAVISVKAGWNS